MTYKGIDNMLAPQVPGPLGPIIIEQLIKNLPLILKAITAFVDALKLPRTEEPDKLGDKAIQAEDESITPEDYDDYNDYYNAIEKFNVDDDKSKTIDENEKINKGIEIIVRLVDVNYPQMQLPKLLETMSKSDSLQDFVTPEHFVALAKEALNDPEFMEQLNAFISGQDMGEVDYAKVVGKLVEIEANIHSEKSVDECRKYVESLG